MFTPEIDKRLFALREQGYSFSQIAARLTLEFGSGHVSYTKDQVQKRYQAISPTLRLVAAPAHIAMPYFQAHFDERGRPREPVGLTKLADLAQYVESLDRRLSKTLVLSDLHVDQHDEALLVEALNAHRDADLVVINGDALDIYAYSRFRREANRPIEGEIEAWMRIQAEYLSRFPWVVITDSNHAQRIPRAVTIPDGLQFLLEPNIMRHLALPFCNIVALDDWWYQVGDVIYAHGDYAARRAPRTAEQVAAWFRARLGSGQFPELRPFRVLVQAHTHRVGCVVLGGIKVIESGCLAKLPLDYSRAAHQVRWQEPQANGYVVVVQDRGRAILNECREYYVEPASA